MSEEENIVGDLDRVARLMLTSGGQMAERIARLREDRHRRDQASTAQEAAELQRLSEQQQRALERERREAVEAARSTYGGIRDPRFFAGDADQVQIRVGEALVVAHSMRDHDPLAVAALDHLRLDLAARHGANAAEYEQAAIRRYEEELAELRDRDRAQAEADAAREAAGETTLVDEREDLADLYQDRADHAHTDGETADAAGQHERRKQTDQEGLRAVETTQHGHHRDRDETLTTTGGHRPPKAAKVRQRPNRTTTRGR